MTQRNVAAMLRDDAKTVTLRFIAPNFHKGVKEYTPINQGLLAGYGLLTSLGDSISLSSKLYTYVTTLPLKKDDIVVVLTMGNICLAVIDTVDDDEVLIELSDDTQYEWVISKVDTDYFQKLVLENFEIEKALSRAYKQRAKNSSRELLLAGTDDETKQKILAITSPKES